MSKTMSIKDMPRATTSPQNKIYVELVDFILGKLTIPSPRIELIDEGMMKLQWVGTEKMVTIYIGQDGALTYLVHMAPNNQVWGSKMDAVLIEHLSCFHPLPSFAATLGFTQ